MRAVEPKHCPRHRRRADESGAECRAKTSAPTGPRLLAPEAIADAIDEKRSAEGPTLFRYAARAVSQGRPVPWHQRIVVEELCFFLLDGRRDAFGLGAPTGTRCLEVAGVTPDAKDGRARRYVAASGSFQADGPIHDLTAAHNLDRRSPDIGSSSCLDRAPVSAADPHATVPVPSHQKYALTHVACVWWKSTASQRPTPLTDRRAMQVCKTHPSACPTSRWKKYRSSE